MTFFGTAWRWLKRNWKWLLLPVGIVIWLVGRLMARKTVVVESSALGEHAEVERKVEAQAEEKKAELAQEREAQLAGIAAEHAAKSTSITQQHVAEAAATEGDSEKVNDLLSQVSKDMRK